MPSLESLAPPAATGFWQFDLQPRTRLVFGAGSVARVGELARELGITKVLLVTDPGIVKAGHADQVRALLESAGVAVQLFAEAQENPTSSSVERCVQATKSARIDALVGLGGGSAMDTAKGCNFLITNGGQMRDYWGVGKAKHAMLPLIAIPTTAGTGSECQSAALIVDDETHQKMACLDPKAAARIAILDPALTISQPQKVTAYTGIDAIAHALETAVSTKRNAFSSILSREAFRLCLNAFPEVLASPTNLDARGRMLLGASLAGMAIENSMLGAAHAAANPLTATFGLVHGLAVGLMLPAVVRFNAGEEQAGDIYTKLEKLLPSNTEIGHANLADFLHNLFRQAGLPASLRDCDITPDAIPALATNAAQQWTATFNPRPLSARDFESLYAVALG